MTGELNPNQAGCEIMTAETATPHSLGEVDVDCYMPGELGKTATPMTMREKVIAQHKSGALARPLCLTACYCTNGVKLESDRARLIEALGKAQALRQKLLAQCHVVPECVLEFCNEARALLRELEAK